MTPEQYQAQAAGFLEEIAAIINRFRATSLPVSSETFRFGREAALFSQALAESL